MSVSEYCDSVRWIMTYMDKDAMQYDSGGSEGDCHSDHVISAARFVEIFGQSPGSRVGVVGLDVGAAPGRVAVAVDEEIFLTCYD